jgi:hypothetical protein
VNLRLFTSLQPLLRLTHHKVGFDMVWLVAIKAAKPNAFFGVREHVSERCNERRSKKKEDIGRLYRK